MGICTNCNHYLVCHYYDKNAEECNHFQDKAKCVEVVHCRDCSNCTKSNWCNLLMMNVKGDWFCSHGRKRWIRTV